VGIINCKNNFGRKSKETHSFRYHHHTVEKSLDVQVMSAGLFLFMQCAFLWLFSTHTSSNRILLQASQTAAQNLLH